MFVALRFQIRNFCIGKRYHLTKILLLKLAVQFLSASTATPSEQVYSTFVAVATDFGTKLLSKRPPRPTETVDIEPVVTARKATLRASTQKIQPTQKNLRKTYDCYEDKRINNICITFSLVIHCFRRSQVNSGPIDLHQGPYHK